MLTLLHLFALFLLVLLGFYVFVANPRNRAHQTFAAFIAFLALWTIKDLIFWDFHDANTVRRAGGRLRALSSPFDAVRAGRFRLGFSRKHAHAAQKSRRSFRARIDFDSGGGVRSALASSRFSRTGNSRLSLRRSPMLSSFTFTRFSVTARRFFSANTANIAARRKVSRSARFSGRWA